MVSFIDALFIMPTAMFAVAFIVPALVMAQGVGAEFKQATSIGMSDTVVQSFSLAFLEAHKNGRPNLEQAAETMSGNNKIMNKRLLQDYPRMFTYFKVKFDSPYDDHDFCDTIIPAELVRKEASNGDSCDFTLTAASGRKINQELRRWRLTIPIRGGNTGVMRVVYQVR